MLLKKGQQSFLIFLLFVHVGWMYENLKNYHYPFIMASASMLLSALIMVYPRRFLMRPSKENNAMIHEIEIEAPDRDTERNMTTETTLFIDAQNTEKQEWREFSQDTDGADIHGQKTNRSVPGVNYEYERENQKFQANYKTLAENTKLISGGLEENT